MQESAQLLPGISLPGPKVPAARVAAVVNVLRQEKGWLTAKQIAHALGNHSESFERVVRAAASVAAPTVVSFPGSPGYKFWDHCSVEEIDHCINSLEAQGKEMIKRANVYRVAYYKRHRVSAAAEIVPVQVGLL